MLPILTILGYLLTGAPHPLEVPARDVRQEASAPAAGVSDVGLKVAVDPATGQIIAEPTEADLEILAEGARRIRRPSPYLLRSFKLDRGGEGVFLDGWADHALEVRVGSDGKLRMVCAQGDEHDPDDRPVKPAAEEANLR